MPSLPEIQSEAIKWQKRIGLISSQGLNPSPITELAKTDLSRIAQGGSPYPEQQYISMIHSAYTGQVNTPPSHGTDWNPMEIAGNALKDISMDVRSFLPGLVHEGADIINPHKWERLSTEGPQVLGDVGKLMFAGGSPSDFAKEVQALPILGPLVPGMFALSAGTSGMTEHPLNFALDVFAIASPASKLAAAPIELAADDAGALSMLKEGHPLGAIAQATGLRDYTARMIKNLPEPFNELGYMPVWNKLGELSRVFTRKFAESVIKELQDAGLVSGKLSSDDAAYLAYQALHYNPRYAQPVRSVSPQDVASAHDDPTLLLDRVPPDTDLVAYTVGPAENNSVIYFDKADALKSLPGGLDPGDVENMIDSVRVAKHDITHDQGGWHGKDMIPLLGKDKQPIFYTPETVKQLMAIRDFVNRFRGPKSIKRMVLEGQRAHDLVVLEDEFGHSTTYRRDSLPVKAHEAAAKAATERNAKRTVLDAEAQKTKDARRAYQATQQEHYAQFGESAADAMQRTPTAPSIAAIATAAGTFIDHLMNVNPREARVAQQLNEAFHAAATDSTKTARVESIVNGLIGQLGRDPRLSEELAYAKMMRDNLRNLRSRSKRARAAHIAHKEAQARLAIAHHDYTLASLAHEAKQKEFNDAIHSNAPDAAYPLMDSTIRNKLEARALTQYLSDVKAINSGTVRGDLAQRTKANGIATTLKQLRDAYQLEVGTIWSAKDRSVLETAVGADTLAAVEKDVFNDWAQFGRAGYDPIWLSNVDPAHYMKMTFHDIRPLPDRAFRTEAERNRVFDYTGPGVLDIRAQLPHLAIEWLRQEATFQFTDWLINRSKIIMKRSDLLNDQMKRFKNEEFANARIDEEYVHFNAKKYVGHDLGLAAGDEWMIPKGVADGFERLMQGNRLPYPGPLKAARRVWKVTVLTGPRHFVHVAVGSLMMEVLAEPGAVLDLLRQPVQLYQWARSGITPPEIEAEIGKAKLADLGDFRKGNYEERIDEFMDFSDRIWQYKTGGVMGRMIGQKWAGSKTREAIVSGTQKLNNFENAISDMYRASVLLHELRNNATNEKAMAKVNKIFIDVDNLTPFERSTIRNVFPFWTFTKHILRYVLTYPSDHPLRASILSHLAQQIEEDQASGDPARLAKLFFLGEPDSSGKVMSVDFANANPFRSMASIFSMQGFFQGLAPELQLGLKAGFGFDPMTGLPTFRPHLTYDAYSGTNKAATEPLSVFDFVGAFIPQADIIDHYMMFTDTMKQLKKSNPEAYSRSLFQAINAPFILAPINIYDVRAKSAAAQYVDASQAVNDAMRTGNTEPLLKFVAVPFEGQLYDSEQVANYIDHFHEIFPQFAPKAVMKPAKRRKTQL